MNTHGKTMMPKSSPFSALKKRLWLGTLATDVLMLTITAFFWPRLLFYAFMGMLMGVFYLWSLMFNADYPKRGVQFVFSLMRVGFLAYLVVKLSHLRMPELTIVMCGLLSYKLMLTVEYVVQALPAFRGRVKTASLPSEF
jgi:hypothetical protein